MILSICDKSYLMQIILIVKTFFKIACLLAPFLVMFFSIIGTFKIVQSGKEEDLKDYFKVSIKRLIAGLVIFFIPTIINYLYVGLLGNSDIDFLVCFESASKEKVESLKQKEEAEAEAEKKTKEKEDEALLKKAWEEEQKQKGAKKQSFEEWKNKKEEEERQKILEQQRQQQAQQEQQQNNGSSNENVTVTTGGINPSDFNAKLSSMSTPSISMLQSAAAKNNISNDYLIVIIGTTANEGYVNDAFLNYGWASSMINNPVSISQMQGWDPYHSGEANFYSQTNVNKGYNNASDTVLKSVYLALTERNTKIAECNGMYSETPSSYNLIYKSSVYNCSVYERK